MAFTMKVRGAPAALSIFDHDCNTCGCRFELTLTNRDEHELPWRCPDCDSPDTFCVDGTSTAPVTIVRGNSDFSERQSERLAKRSSEHFKREGRDEAIERQRMQFKREGMVQ